MGHRKCEDCIWFEQCGQEEICECYTPESMEEDDINNYNEDLMMREDVYAEHLDEQNSWFSHYTKDGDI